METTTPAVRITTESVTLDLGDVWLRVYLDVRTCMATDTIISATVIKITDEHGNLIDMHQEPRLSDRVLTSLYAGAPLVKFPSMMEQFASYDEMEAAR